MMNEKGIKGDLRVPEDIFECLINAIGSEFLDSDHLKQGSPSLDDLKRLSHDFQSAK